jgi:hypothetical protein
MVIFWGCSSASKSYLFPRRQKIYTVLSLLLLVYGNSNIYQQTEDILTAGDYEELTWWEVFDDKRANGELLTIE